MADIFENYDFDIFAENLKKKRKELNITQEGLAALINRERKWVSSIERKKSIPDFEDVIRICNALGCDISYLFGRTIYTKDLYLFMGSYLGLSENATRAMGVLKNKPIVSTLIESLLTEEYEDEETGKKRIEPSQLLLDLVELCTVNYGPNHFGTLIELNDIYSTKHSEVLLSSDIYRLKELRLFDHLRQYINEQRVKHGLPIYDENL